MASEDSPQQLHLQYALGDSTQWEIYGRMEFPSSGSNKVRIYLMADDTVLEDSRGYFIQIGESGSADALTLYRSDGSSDVLLAAEPNGSFGADTVEFRLLASRTRQGEFSISFNNDGTRNYSSSIQAIDNTYQTDSSFFALQCFFTTTRTDKFFFDDMQIESIDFPDLNAPMLDTFEIVDAQSIRLRYDEEVDIDNVNFIIDPGLGATSAVIDDQDSRVLLVRTAETMVNFTDYAMEISGIRDESGNRSQNTTINWTFFQRENPEPFEILITELMVDPSPPLGLPDHEYIELYNPTDKVFDLEGMEIADPSRSATLGTFLLQPGQRVILHSTSATGFAGLGDTLAVVSLPSLNNSSDIIVLSDSEGNTVHQLSYNTSWYGSSDKAEGGYALEMISEQLICQGSANWRASNSLVGGTPGQANSVASDTIDIAGPRLVKVIPQDETTLSVIFDETLDTESATNPNNYRIEGLGITAVEFDVGLGDQVSLLLAQPLSAGVLYELSVSSFISDCLFQSGEKDQSLSFGLPQPITEGDLIINEILFNPVTGGSRFVELFNISNKVVNVKDLLFAKRDEFGELEDIIRNEQAHILLPGEWMVFANDTNNIGQVYTVPNRSQMLPLSLPSYPDKEGNVILLNFDNQTPVILDEVPYSDTWHHPFLDTKDGVSLERVSPNLNSEAADTWQSSSEAAGFGTPTGPNSQSTIIPNQSENEKIDIPQPRLSPDGDGFEDFLSIFYTLGDNDYTLTIHILDDQGRLVRRLVENELLGSEGQFKWDGANDAGILSGMGIYIVLSELVRSDGTVISDKHPIVLARDLN